MLPKNRILLIGLLIILAGLLVICFSPAIVSTCVRLWLGWKGRQQGLNIQVAEIDAPFLQPAVLQRLRVTSAPGAPVKIDIKVARATVDLNLTAILLRLDGRAIRTLSVEGLHVDLYRKNAAGRAFVGNGWATLQKLLPDSFNLDPFDLRLENGSTLILLRSISLSASQTEAGRFRAEEVTIASPLFRQTFSKLRGATKWEDARLTVAGLSLARGLDVPSLTADVSHLDRQNIGLDFDVDAFGGKIRASISNEWGSRRATRNVVASATDISLAQTAEALGFTDHLSGSIRACKFTFRGNPLNPSHATAALWMELTAPTWHERTADVVMLGVALYNRQIDVQQLYVKQNANQFTLSGEASFPTNSSDWLRPDFRGDVSASISNLGDFARLFGASPGDFAGEITVAGTVNTRDRKLGGHLTADGTALKVFKTSIDGLSAKLNLKTTEIEIEQLEIKRGSDFIHAQGTVDSANSHRYAGTVSAALGNIADYTEALPATLRIPLSTGAAKLDWSGHGDANSHSGEFRVNAHGIRVAAPIDLAPFDAQLDAAYSPRDLFSRQLHLTNGHASLTGFATVSANYLQVQALAFDLNGKPALRGNVFLPLSLPRLFRGNSLRDALDPDQKADLDFAIEQSDLAELCTALTGRAAVRGTFSARMLVFGGLDALQGWSEMHLRDFALAHDAPPASSDAEMRFVSGMMNTKAVFLFPGSDPVSIDLSSQIYLGHERSRAALEPVSVEMNFPAVFPAHLPRYLSHDLFSDGILSGKISISETPSHPSLSGDLQLINGKLNPTFLWPDVTAGSGRIVFGGKSASLDFVNISTKEIDLSLSGEIDFADPSALVINVSSSSPMVDMTPRIGIDCVRGIHFSPAPATEMMFPKIESLTFRGSTFQPGWTVTLQENERGRRLGALANRNPALTLQLCTGLQPHQETLALGCESWTQTEGIGQRKPARPRRP